MGVPRELEPLSVGTIWAGWAFAHRVPGRAGRPCEDAARVHPRADAVALADGVGSSEHGRQAAAFAVSLALGALREAVVHGLEVEEVGPFFAALWRREVGTSPTWATTLLVAIRRQDGVVVAQAGDGLVAWPGGRLEGSGGAWSNQTEALPMAQLVGRELPMDTPVLLATDGVSDDLVAGSVPRLLHRLVGLGEEVGLGALGCQVDDWLRQWAAPGSFDDRSIGLLVPGGGGSR